MELSPPPIATDKRASSSSSKIPRKRENGEQQGEVRSGADPQHPESKENGQQGEQHPERMRLREEQKLLPEEGGMDVVDVAVVEAEEELLRLHLIQLNKAEIVQRSNVHVEERSVALQLKKRWALGLAYEDDEVRAERTQKLWESEDTVLRNRRRKQQEEELEVKTYLDQSAINRAIAAQQNAAVRERTRIRALMKAVETAECEAREVVHTEEQKQHRASFLARYTTLHMEVFQKEECYFRNIIVAEEIRDCFAEWTVIHSFIFNVLLPVEALVGEIPSGDAAAMRRLSSSSSRNADDPLSTSHRRISALEKNKKMEEAATDDADSAVVDENAVPPAVVSSPTSFASEAGQALLSAALAFDLMATDTAHAAAMETVEYLVNSAIASIEQVEVEEEFETSRATAKVVERLRLAVSSRTATLNDQFQHLGKKKKSAKSQ